MIKGKGRGKSGKRKVERDPSSCRGLTACYLSPSLSSQPNSFSWSRWKSQPCSRECFRAVRARWSLILTLSTDRPRTSAISGLVRPSMSLRIRVTRYSSGRPSMKLRIHVFISLRRVMVSRDSTGEPLSRRADSFSSFAWSVTASALKAALRNRSRATLVAMR